MVGGSLSGCKMISISNLHILQEISNDDDDEEEEEKEVSAGFKEVRVDGSTSSNSSSESGCRGDEDGEDDDGHNESGNPRPTESTKLGL